MSYVICGVRTRLSCGQRPARARNISPLVTVTACNWTPLPITCRPAAIFARKTPSGCSRTLWQVQSISPRRPRRRPRRRRQGTRCRRPARRRPPRRCSSVTRRRAPPLLLLCHSSWGPESSLPRLPKPSPRFTWPVQNLWQLHAYYSPQFACCGHLHPRELATVLKIAELRKSENTTRSATLFHAQGNAFYILEY